MAKPQTPEERQAQPDKFRDLARKLAATRTRRPFEEKVKRVARAPKPRGENEAG